MKQYKKYKNNKYKIKEHQNGDKYWYLNNKLHREDGPSIECSNGDKFWFINGLLHREDGPACDCFNGNKSWYINGKLHREKGPAVDHLNSYKKWYINGKRIYNFNCVFPYKNDEWIEIKDLNYIGPYKRYSCCFIKLPIETKEQRYVVYEE